MQEIGAGIVILFQVVWIAIVFWLYYHIIKLKRKIFQLRAALFPFALVYQNIRDQKHWSGDNTIQDYRTAHKEYIATYKDR